MRSRWSGFPAPGNLSLRGQRIWFGPALAGTTVTLRIDVNRLHVLIGGGRHKTLPSKLSGRDLKALLAGGGARPAGPWADDPGPAKDTNGAVEVDRTVNAVGYVGSGGDKVLVGWPFAGQRVTLRLGGKVLQVLDEQRVLQATLASPLPAGVCKADVRPDHHRCCHRPPSRSPSGRSAASAAS